jgi:predicted DNA-binding transcriptional regulator AlpA
MRECKSHVSALVTIRGLRREQAAAYIGVSPTKFDQLVADRRMPHPLRIDGCVVWDVQQLDLAFDALRDQNDRANPWD